MGDSQCLIKGRYSLDKLDFYKWPSELLHKLAECIGKPYKYNCFDLSGFDCYTLVYYLYSLIGINLPKENISSYNLKIHTKIINEKLVLFDTISFEQRQPFDILLFETRRNINAHIGLTLDYFHFIHILKENTVQIEKFFNNAETTDIRKIYRWK